MTNRFVDHLARSTSSSPQQVETVTGSIDASELGITDAHSHVWIEKLAGVPKGAPVLDDLRSSIAELRLFHQAGGGAIVDCQPGGCGRNGNRLREISEASGVRIVACTGFHRMKYYQPDAPIRQFSSTQAQNLYVAELQKGLEETLSASYPVRAGFLKVACEVTLRQSPIQLLEGAAQACLITDAAIQVHTEQGADAEAIATFFVDQGLSMSRLIFCHMDKRPDFQLHRDLAQSGILLEYDTFFRSKYDPEANLWPLLEKMLSDGLGDSISIAADFADMGNWISSGGSPGLIGLITEVMPRVRSIAGRDPIIEKLFSQNIGNRLAKRLKL